MNDPTVEHIPVLSEILAEQINLPRDGVMVDATIGHGGHSLLFGQFLGPDGVLVGLDVDEEAIGRAERRLEGLVCKVILVNSNFSRITEILGSHGIERVGLILADLGLCSAQVAGGGMGLSFRADEPLDMRIDKSLKTTAADIVNEADEKTLAELIHRYGQDRAARRIARSIVRRRKGERITTTGQLVSLICGAVGRPGQKRRVGKHPARRTFQALRIAVNRELENLERLLFSAPDLLGKDGYLAVISYHSLEDRLVKQDFKRNAERGVYRILTKKPLGPSSGEIAENWRARSAKLRIAQRA